MSPIPETMIKAAAEALIPGGYADEMMMEAARDALAAAFAKLPECKGRAVEEFDEFLYNSGIALPGNVRLVRSRILAALAKWGQP